MSKKIIQPFFNHKPRKKLPFLHPSIALVPPELMANHGHVLPSKRMYHQFYLTKKSQDVAHNYLENQKYKGNMNPKLESCFLFL